MSKTIKIKNKSLFVKNFLLPISKISDSSILELNGNLLSCKVCTSDNSVIFFTCFATESENDETIVLNCPDIKKLIRAIDAISRNDEISFDIEENNLSYKDKSIKFKYHLLEDGIIKQPKLNLKKLDDTEFNTTFILRNDYVKELIKGSVFSSDSNKIYISTGKEDVYAELTDKTRNNIDTITLQISDSYDGDSIESLPFSFEIFRLMECSGKDILVKINAKLGLVIFEILDNYNKMLYVMSSLIK
jgi:hypothetical protein